VSSARAANAAIEELTLASMSGTGSALEVGWVILAQDCEAEEILTAQSLSPA